MAREPRLPRIGHGPTQWHCSCHPSDAGHAIPSLAADCEDRTAQEATR